jgi:hypothetical protein
LLVDLAALGEVEVGLEELAGSQRGARLLDRDGVLVPVVGEVVRGVGGDGDRLARAEAPLPAVDHEPQRARDDLGPGLLAGMDV